MGYKLYYPQVGKRKYPMHPKAAKRIWFAAAAIGCAVLLLGISLWYGGPFWLLPGDPEITGAALQTLIDKLRDGEALGEAVTAFCREVIAGAG